MASSSPLSLRLTYLDAWLVSFSACHLFLSNLFGQHLRCGVASVLRGHRLGHPGVVGWPSRWIGLALPASIAYTALGGPRRLHLSVVRVAPPPRIGPLHCGGVFWRVMSLGRWGCEVNRSAFAHRPRVVDGIVYSVLTMCCGAHRLGCPHLGSAGPTGRTGTSYARASIAFASWHLDVDSVRPGG